MGTVVVNLRKEAFDVYIGRTGHGQDGYFGNPFVLGRDGNRAEVIRKYREWFEQRIKADPIFRARIEALRGKRLGCFCKPLACHGNVIVEWLESH